VATRLSDPVDSIKQANSLYRRGNAQEALAALQPALEADALDAILLAGRIRWSARQHDLARAVLESSRSHAGHPLVKQALWAYDERLRSPMLSRRLVLKRRGREDAAFVRRCWDDAEFMSRFHRMARKLGSDADLNAVLETEANASLLTSNSLHWTVHDRKGDKLGFTSLVEYSAAHRRAELMVGLLDPRPGHALEATLLTMDVAFRRLELNKLCSVIYSGNDKALSSTLHLGFSKEGVQREQVFDPGAGAFLDLHLAGMLAREYFESDRLRKLFDRLIGGDMRC
jgi:RimJ/RimL family protein N-acetyltransferase